MNLTETEKAYLAGLFDGEGSVGYYKYSKQKTHLPQVQIANADPRVMEWLKAKIPFGSVGINKTNKFTVFQWCVRGKKGVSQFLRAIQPFLVVKRDQSELLLNFLDAEQAVRGIGNGKRLSENDLYKRENLVDALRHLKTASYLTAS